VKPNQPENSISMNSYEHKGLPI